VNFTLHCDLVSVNGVVFSGLVETVVVRSSLGELGIVFGHAPLLTDLVASDVRIITQGGKQLLFKISGGFLEVKNNVVKILAITVKREL